jgi:uncharacterized protein Usg
MKENQQNTSLSLSDFELCLLGYKLTTAEIIYRLPDYPGLLQTFLWQQLDLGPQFPRLSDFLDFWEQNIDGKLYHVKVIQGEQLSCNKIITADLEIDYKVH